MGTSPDAKVKIGLLSVAPSTGAVVYDGAYRPLHHETLLIPQVDGDSEVVQSLRTASCAPSSRLAYCICNRVSSSSNKT